VLLGNSCLVLEFKHDLSLGVSGFSLLLFLLFGKRDFRYFGFTFSFGSGGIFLFVESKVSLSSLFAELVSKLLISGLLFFKSIDNTLSFFVGAEELLSAESLDIRIEFDHYSQVLQRILLSGSSNSGLFGRVNLALNFAGSDQTMEVRIGDERSW